ncbi:hypothetical protein R1flu_005150 [Riccia fluitans]|uniref:RING-type E3 ubiquitin transferase n=1 Tax=Riccia fluitans TaxID=41844 RepID=A0ABD1YSC4_9MARC
MKAVGSSRRMLDRYERHGTYLEVAWEAEVWAVVCGGHRHSFEVSESASWTGEQRTPSPYNRTPFHHHITSVVYPYFLMCCLPGNSARDESTTASNVGMAWTGESSGARVGDVSLGPKRPKFTRAAEVRAKCPQVDLRKEDAPTRTRKRRPLMQRLSFYNGDWEQEEEAPQLMPYMSTDETGDSPYWGKTQLASLVVTNVARNQSPVRNLSGMLELVITNGLFGADGTGVQFQGEQQSSSPFVGTPESQADFPFSGSSGESNFNIVPGFSSLTIEVEGVYQQARDEDTVCMLGCAYLPSPDAGITWSNIQNKFGTKQLDRNCDIMVQLHYPLTYNLTSRVIRGQITSLKTPDQPYYFWPISLTSQVTVDALYETTAKDLAESVCKSDSAKYVDAYKPTEMDFCDLANQYLNGGWMDIDTNWDCTASQEFCGKIGPFASFSDHYHHVKEEDYNSSKAQIMVQNFRSQCFNEEETEIPVSSVFRLVPVAESLTVAHSRSALDGQTIVTEGFWTNASDHLCMVGCSISDNNQQDHCNLRVCLSIPLSLNIKHRNVFDGSISSIKPVAPFHPLSFHVKLDYNRGFPWRLSSELHYNYTRLEGAEAVMGKYEPMYNNFHTSWLSYPKLIGKSLSHYQLLSEDLRLDHTVDSKDMSHVRFDIVAIDEYLPFLWSGFFQTASSEVAVPAVNDSIRTDTDPTVTNRLKEKRKYLNIAGTLSITQPFVWKEFKVFTEGLYNPKDGKMYMVGCRSVTAPWEVIHEVWNLDEGMDCDIEVVLIYPATFASWLSNPSVRVVIKSTRTEDDPFYFDEIKVQTKPILYRKQREQLLSQKSVEGALSVLTLSLMLGCIISQILHVGNHPESAPYVSLVMVAIQAMGYAIPLVTGAEALLTRKFDYRRDFFYRESGWSQMIIYLDKILTLVALLFMVRLFEVVWKSRKALPSAHSPGERGVAITCFILHILGFISVMTLHTSVSRARVFVGEEGLKPLSPAAAVEFIPTMDNFSVSVTPEVMDVNRMGLVWKVVLQEYAGLVDDLFLLPQAVALSLWNVNGKPLRTIFYMGLTFLQIVPHIYDSFRVPVLDDFSFSIYANPSFDFYTSLGNILIPSLASILAVLVYVQQRWKSFLRFPSKFSYKPLSSKVSETELVQNHGRNPLPPIPEDEEQIPRQKPLATGLREIYKIIGEIALVPRCTCCM